MRHQEIQFFLSPEVLALGVTGVCYAIGEMSIPRSSQEFEQLLPDSLRAVTAQLTAEKLDADPILADFRRLHEEVCGPGPKPTASPEALLRAFLKSGKFPRISLPVDVYNLISIQTRLSLGSHDIERVTGNISLRRVDGTERFRPLGATEEKKVARGEYCYVDDANDVLCRLEVRQCDKSKLTAQTRQAFFMIQGNRETDETLLRSAGDRLVEMITRYCGGVPRLLWAPWKITT